MQCICISPLAPNSKWSYAYLDIDGLFHHIHSNGAKEGVSE